MASSFGIGEVGQKAKRFSSRAKLPPTGHTGSVQVTQTALDAHKTHNVARVATQYAREKASQGYERFIEKAAPAVERAAPSIYHDERVQFADKIINKCIFECSKKMALQTGKIGLGLEGLAYLILAIPPIAVAAPPFFITGHAFFGHASLFSAIAVAAEGLHLTYIATGQFDNSISQDDVQKGIKKCSKDVAWQIPGIAFNRLENLRQVEDAKSVQDIADNANKSSSILESARSGCLSIIAKWDHLPDTLYFLRRLLFAIKNYESMKDDVMWLVNKFKSFGNSIWGGVKKDVMWVKNEALDLWHKGRQTASAFSSLLTNKAHGAWDWLLENREWMGEALKSSMEIFSGISIAALGAALIPPITPGALLISGMFGAAGAATHAWYNVTMALGNVKGEVATGDVWKEIGSASLDTFGAAASAAADSAKTIAEVGKMNALKSGSPELEHANSVITVFNKISAGINKFLGLNILTRVQKSGALLSRLKWLEYVTRGVHVVKWFVEHFKGVLEFFVKAAQLAKPIVNAVGKRIKAVSHSIATPLVRMGKGLVNATKHAVPAIAHFASNAAKSVVYFVASKVHNVKNVVSSDVHKTTDWITQKIHGVTSSVSHNQAVIGDFLRKTIQPYMSGKPDWMRILKTVKVYGPGAKALATVGGDVQALYKRELGGVAQFRNILGIFAAPVATTAVATAKQIINSKPITAISKTVSNAAKKVTSKISNLGKKLKLRRSGTGPEPDVDPSAVRSHLLAQGGMGHNLDIGLRQRLGSHLGFDPGGARLHIGPSAAKAARNLRAEAFTVGNDIFFGERHYNPTSPKGLGLLAHELTHVGQQTLGNGGGLRFSSAAGGDSMEIEAQHMSKMISQSDSRSSFEVENYERKYECDETPINDSDIERLDRISIMALAHAETVMRNEKISYGSAELVEVNVDLHLSTLDDRQAAKIWGEAIAIECKRAIIRASTFTGIPAAMLQKQDDESVERDQSVEHESVEVMTDILTKYWPCLALGTLAGAAVGLPFLGLAVGGAIGVYAYLRNRYNSWAEKQVFPGIDAFTKDLDVQKASLDDSRRSGDNSSAIQMAHIPGLGQIKSTMKTGTKSVVSKTMALINHAGSIVKGGYRSATNVSSTAVNSIKQALSKISKPNTRSIVKTKAQAIADLQKERAFLKKIVNEGLDIKRKGGRHRSETLRFANACQWIDQSKNGLTVVALSPIHDADTRIPGNKTYFDFSLGYKDAKKPNYPEDPQITKSDRMTTYQNGILGMNYPSSHKITIVTPSKNANYTKETISHEVQHSADRHMGEFQNTITDPSTQGGVNEGFDFNIDVNRYVSEFRAYTLTEKLSAPSPFPTEVSYMGMGYNSPIRTRLNLKTSQQKAVFYQLTNRCNASYKDPYGYVGYWYTHSQKFRDTVSNYKQVESGNAANSVRIQELIDVITAHGSRAQIGKCLVRLDAFDVKTLNDIKGSQSFWGYAQRNLSQSNLNYIKDYLHKWWLHHHIGSLVENAESR